MTDNNEQENLTSTHYHQVIDFKPNMNTTTYSYLNYSNELDVIEQKIRILKVAQSAIKNNERYMNHINDEIFRLIRDL